jgi:nucleoside-diphosphate-sugar epimerase
MTKSCSSKVFVPYEVAYSKPIEDMTRRQPDIDRIQQTIGWQPKTSLDKALNAIIKYEKGRATKS